MRRRRFDRVKYGKPTTFIFGGGEYFCCVGDTLDALGSPKGIAKDNFHPGEHAIRISVHTAHSYETEYTWNRDYTECTAREVCPLCEEQYKGHFGKTETSKSITAKEVSLSKFDQRHFRDLNYQHDPGGRRCNQSIE